MRERVLFKSAFRAEHPNTNSHAMSYQHHGPFILYACTHKVMITFTAGKQRKNLLRYQ